MVLSDRKSLFRLMSVSLCIFLLAFALSPVGAQSGDAASQRAALTQMLYTQATGLLAKYNIPAGALDEFLPLIAQGDQEGLVDALGSYGLSGDQVQSILGEAAPLIDQGLNSGIIQEYVAQQALRELDEAGIDGSEYDLYLMAWGDLDALAALLSAQGLSQDEVDAFLADAVLLGELGLDAATFDTYIQEQALFNGLEEAGIPVEDWGDYADALWAGDFEALDELLTDAGIDAEAFAEQASQDYLDAYAAWGFDEDDYNAFQDAVFVDLLAEAQGDPDAMAALLESYGYSQDEIDAFVAADGDPEALAGLLSESGIDEDAIDELSQDSEGDAEGGEEGDSSGG